MFKDVLKQIYLCWYYVYFTVLLLRDIERMRREGILSLENVIIRYMLHNIANVAF